ncbi:MAG: hypothetical protein NC302_01405 [Bacteroidales bacterium]|nr:hypothetical protein [Bacteroidales bacterium]MCM1414540.1 hypothetical protein [bacterium]MCM1422590.1 hypothetical protein [bacterium]
MARSKRRRIGGKAVMNWNAFLEIEHRYGLVEEQLDGFAYWTYFRNILAVDIMTKMDSAGERYVYPGRSGWQKVKARLGTIRYALLYGRLPKGRHDMLILNGERRVWSDHCYECIYTDRIAAEYPDSVVLERPYMQKHFRPVKTKNLVYTDFIEIKAMIHWYYAQIMHKKQIAEVRERMREKICAPIEEICAAYQAAYDYHALLEQMVCGYYVYQVKHREFGKIMDRIKPKIILEVVGYNIDCMIVNELAAERSIPTAELQHGVTGETHISYNYYPNTKVKQFPQYFFSFSRFWIETAHYPIPSNRLKEIGFLHLSEKADLAKKNTVKPALHQIIFISQPKIGKVLSEIAVELDALIDKQQYKIIYKLHPGEYERWRERYLKLAASGIEVVDHNKVDLYELFAASEYQVGGYGSTATFEGLEFDLKTYIMREGAYPPLVALCEKGIAVFFDTAQDLHRLILLDSEKPRQVTEHFWKENALENMKREIEAIIAH